MDEKLKGMKTLLAEDNCTNSELMINLLEDKGAVVDHALNGKEALEMYENSAKEEYSIILMDVMMPEMDGIEATKQIRALERKDSKTIPIVAITAGTSLDEIKNNLKAGMNAHLHKPVDPKMLYKTLDMYI